MKGGRGKTHEITTQSETMKCNDSNNEIRKMYAMHKHKPSKCVINMGFICVQIRIRFVRAVYLRVFGSATMHTAYTKYRSVPVN